MFEHVVSSSMYRIDIKDYYKISVAFTYLVEEIKYQIQSITWYQWE